MNLINNLFSDKLTDAIGLVIIHSIWQGVLVAALAALLLFFFRRHDSQVRYGIGVVSLLLMFFISMVTFHSIYHAVPQNRQLLNKLESTPISSTIAAESGNATLGTERTSSPGIWPGLSSFFKSRINHYLPLVVGVWFLMVLFLMFKSTVGFMVNQRLRVRASRNIKNVWQDRLKILSLKTGVKQSVLLAESERVKSPVTIGILKPVILLPLGLIMSLPQDEVEAVLAHELAHISRKDYLINILQHLIEILFFYHPAIRWISKLVRNERENCCDDIAVSVCGNSLNVARALSNMAVPNRKNPVLAQAAAGSNWRLFKRIKRLLNPPKMDYRMGWSTVVIFFLGISFLAVMLSANVTRNFSLEMKKSDPVAEGEKISPGSQGDTKDKAEIKQLKDRTMLKRFMVKNDTYIQISGKIKIKKGAVIHCRIVDAKTDKQIWKCRVKNKGDGIHPFADRLFLKKGTYDLESDQNCQDLFIKDLKLNSSNILFLSAPEDEEVASERELEYKKQELIRREKDLAEREEKIRKREEALNRLERKKLGEERKILEKEAVEKARMEEEEFKRQKRIVEKEVELKSKLLAERLRMEDKLHDLQRELENVEKEQRMRAEEISRNKEDELAFDRKELLEKREREKAEMEKKLNRLKGEVKELREKEAKISGKILEDLDEEVDKIRDDFERIGDDLEKVEEKIRIEEEKIKGEELFFKKLINELMKDKLIDDEDDFELKLTSAELLINWKKQPKKYFIKYKKMIEKHRGKKLERGTKFQIINRK